MKTKPKFYRQGDVLLKRIDHTPTTTPANVKELTLAHGETTGHHHTLYGERGGIEVWEPNVTQRNRIFRVTKPTELRHQEHGTHLIQPGTYIQGPEREFDPFEQIMKAVVD
jgi:hypothetical protein